MLKLNLPTCELRFTNKNEQLFVFDIIRKKEIVLNPEEWVRQHIIHFLISTKKYPISLINVEKEHRINSTKKRTDIIIFSTKGTPQVIVECKAPNVEITQKEIDQIVAYNYVLKADYLLITNGLTHYHYKINYTTNSYEKTNDLPNYQSHPTEGIC